MTIGGSLEHGGDGSRHRTIALDLRYHPSAERIVNVGYRRFPVDTTALGQVRESVGEVTESVSLSGHLDLGRNLRVLGIARYALDEDTMTELYAGLELRLLLLADASVRAALPFRATAPSTTARSCCSWS